MVDFESDLSKRLSAVSGAPAPDIAGQVVVILKREEAAKKRTMFWLAAFLTILLAVASAIAVAGADRALNMISTSTSLGWALRAPLAIIAVIIALGTSAIVRVLFRQNKR